MTAQHQAGSRQPQGGAAGKSTGRTCRTCGETKPIGEFYYNRTRDSYHPDCKPCVLEKRRAQYRAKVAADPSYRERLNQQMLERFRERYRTDPAFREKVIRRSKERYYTDPAYRAALIARTTAARRADPERRARDAARKREKRRARREAAAQPAGGDA